MIWCPLAMSCKNKFEIAMNCFKKPWLIYQRFLIKLHHLTNHIPRFLRKVNEAIYHLSHLRLNRCLTHNASYMCALNHSQISFLFLSLGTEKILRKVEHHGNYQQKCLNVAINGLRVKIWWSEVPKRERGKFFQCVIFSWLHGCLIKFTQMIWSQASSLLDGFFDDALRAIIPSISSLKRDRKQSIKSLVGLQIFYFLSFPFSRVPFSGLLL